MMGYEQDERCMCGASFRSSVGDIALDRHVILALEDWRRRHTAVCPDLRYVTENERSRWVNNPPDELDIVGDKVVVRKPAKFEE